MQKRLDRIAIAVSGICLIHCLALPASAIFFPILGTSFLSDESLHLALLFAVLPNSILAFGLGCRRHKDGKVLLLGILGISFLIFAGFLAEAGERMLTMAGGVFLILGHVRNHRRCREEQCNR